MICKKCGTDFEGVFCPECGTKVEQEIITENRIEPKEENVANAKQGFSSNEAIGKIDTRPQKNPGDKKGILSFVLGIISWIGVLTVIIPVICSILSIVFGISALKKKTKHKFMAMLGIILSILMIAFLLFAFISSPEPTQTPTSSVSNGVEAETTNENQISMAEEMVEEDSSGEAQIETQQSKYHFEADFVVDGTDSGLFDKSFFEQLSDDELRVAKNEIFARHGRMFNDPDLQAYFDSKEWYQGTYSPEEFDKIQENELNGFEKENLQIMSLIEEERGVNVAENSDPNENKEISQKEYVEVEEPEEINSEQSELQIGDQVDNYWNNDYYIGEEITLHFDYIKSTLSYNDDVSVFLDGEDIKDMKAGKSDSATVYLETGTHKIYVRSNERLKNRKSSTLKFDVDENTMILYFTIEDSGFVGLKMNMNENN